MTNLSKPAALIAATVAALALHAPSIAATATVAASDVIHCAGINSCKGTSDCATAENKCKGQNACKGHGFVKAKAGDCLAKKGKIIDLDK
jgi:hypothetical protein